MSIQKRKTVSRTETRMNKVKAAILAKIADDIMKRVPLKRTDITFDENDEMILYSVDYVGLVAHEGDELLDCILCQRVLYADRDKVSRYAATKEPVELREAERNTIFANLVAAGIAKKRCKNEA